MHNILKILRFDTNIVLQLFSHNDNLTPTISTVFKPLTGSFRTIMAYFTIILFFLLAGLNAASSLSTFFNFFPPRSSFPISFVNSGLVNYTATQFLQYGAQGVTIKYGPFTVPSSSENGGMAVYSDNVIRQPCMDCLITFMQAGLEYPNGTYANTDTGIMLHHIVMHEDSSQDLTCPQISTRFFASGNERTPIDLTVNGTSKTGYYIPANTSMAYHIELMNERSEPSNVIVTLNFEYISGQPSGFRSVTTWWLDVAGPCKSSDDDVPGAPNNVIFNYTSPTPYAAPFGGSIVTMAGHMHDGGTAVTVSENGNNICTFTPTYAATPDFVDQFPTYTANQPGMEGVGNLSVAMNHISNISVCNDVGTFKAGNEFGIQAFYNASAHALMLGSDGQPLPVMGISLMYVTNETATGGVAGVPSETSTVTGTTTGSRTGASASVTSGSWKVGGNSLTLGLAVMLVMVVFG